MATTLIRGKYVTCRAGQDARSSTVFTARAAVQLDAIEDGGERPLVAQLVALRGDDALQYGGDGEQHEVEHDDGGHETDDQPSHRNTPITRAGG